MAIIVWKLRTPRGYQLQPSNLVLPSWCLTWQHFPWTLIAMWFPRFPDSITATNDMHIDFFFKMRKCLTTPRSSLPCWPCASQLSPTQRRGTTVWREGANNAVLYCSSAINSAFKSGHCLDYFFALYMYSYAQLHVLCFQWTFTSRLKDFHSWLLCQVGSWTISWAFCCISPFWLLQGNGTSLHGLRIPIPASPQDLVDVPQFSSST